MTWNWQQENWPHFDFNPKGLEALEAAFLRNSGFLMGSFKHLNEDDQGTLTIDLLSDEALKTSEIEGELLNRDSLQSSIRRHLGLGADQRKILPREQGISDMMIDLYRTFAEPLTHEMLFRWHDLLFKSRMDLDAIGQYRTGTEPMQVVSGPDYKPKIHFEAPPSQQMQKEMTAFIDWFNATAPGGKNALPALTRAGIAHLYFVSIHPFEDGNGRIGRALAEKVLAQSMGQPTLIALSRTIQTHKKKYYDALEFSNKEMLITDWLDYFADTMLEAQAYTQRLIEFILEKTRLYDRFRNQLNDRQEKAIARMFRQGPEGFNGGLSAENYIALTGTSRATATRDLQDLVEKGALSRTGNLKSTRYHLNINQ